MLSVDLRIVTDDFRLLRLCPFVPRIAYGIAKGMYYLHNQYPVVIHRDLKSPNVLLGTNVREVNLTDFGLSRLRVESLVDTGPGGTPEWMAPELLRQQPFNEQSDVFSFGVILWELVMCEKPWKEVRALCLPLFFLRCVREYENTNEGHL